MDILQPSEVVKLLIDSILSAEKEKARINQDAYVDCEESKYRKLGEKCLEKGMYDEALEMYLVVNDVNKVEFCFNSLIEKHPDRAGRLCE